MPNKVMKAILGIDESDFPKIQESWNEFLEGWKNPREARYMILVGIVVMLAVTQAIDIAREYQNKYQNCAIVPSGGDILISLYGNENGTDMIRLNGDEIVKLQEILTNNRTASLIGDEVSITLKDCKWGRIK